MEVTEYNEILAIARMKIKELERLFDGTSNVTRKRVPGKVKEITDRLNEVVVAISPEE